MMQAARQNSGTLRPLEKAAVRSTMRQLAQVLAFTHQQGITHRDIKPENVLLQDNENIALCDFGISKDIISGAYESTLNLSAASTLACCAPGAGLPALMRVLPSQCLSVVVALKAFLDTPRSAVYAASSHDCKLHKLLQHAHLTSTMSHPVVSISFLEYMFSAKASSCHVVHQTMCNSHNWCMGQCKFGRDVQKEDVACRQQRLEAEPCCNRCLVFWNYAARGGSRKAVHLGGTPQPDGLPGRQAGCSSCSAVQARPACR